MDPVSLLIGVLILAVIAWLIVRLLPAPLSTVALVVLAVILLVWLAEALPR